MTRIGEQIIFLFWRIFDGDNTYRVRYNLKKESVVWDVGGYVGDWTQNINDRYHSRIVIFEPTKRYAKILRARFEGVSNITIREYGLSEKDCTANFSDAGLSSSQYKKGSERVKLKDVAKELQNQKRIDLMKLNIEGSEYNVLERLIATGEIAKIDQLQIQFHRFVPDAKNRRKAIVNALRKTHRRTFNFPFAWEGWKKR